MRLILLPFVLLFSSPDLSGQDNKPLRSGNPTTVTGKAFEKVVLTADSKGPVDWDYDEDAFPETRAHQVPGEKQLILFPVAKGSFRIRLLMWDEKRFQKITLVISDGPIPDPPPDPSPKPPVPPQPPVKEVLGFVTMARAELAKVPVGARGLASQVADNFESQSAKLAATSGMTIDQANAELREKHRVTLGTQRDAWLPWFTGWKAKADALNASSQLVTTADYVTAFMETASGLRTAGKR